MSITYDFKGQVALVTGAADVSEAALQQALDEITSAGKAIGVVSDVSDEAQVAVMVERTVATFGRLDRFYRAARNRANLLSHIRFQAPHDMHEGL